MTLAVWQALPWRLASWAANSVRRLPLGRSYQVLDTATCVVAVLALTFLGLGWPLFIPNCLPTGKLITAAKHGALSPEEVCLPTLPYRSARPLAERRLSVESDRLFA